VGKSNLMRPSFKNVPLKVVLVVVLKIPIQDEKTSAGFNSHAVWVNLTFSVKHSMYHTVCIVRDVSGN
jgi:hypothetical protein